MTDENPNQNNQNVNLISKNEKENPVKSESSFNLVKKRDSTQKENSETKKSNSYFSIEVSTLEKN